MPRLVTAPTSRPARRPSFDAIHSAVRNAAATSTPEVWRNGIWKISGYICSLPFGTQKIEQHQPAAHADGRIRQVERGPLMLADVEQKEVGDAPPHNSIEHVPRGAPHNQRETKPRKRVQPLAAFPEERPHYPDGRQRERHQ